ncbi:hypothetical protein F5Y09DRAFT_350634 [Xylaria sp. FL1042]|nr:hypothetical protein F5Y09DRAFT_350634 [Xylaria sp. FL1042]
MPRFLFNFWQCGHITNVDDGSIVSENGNLTPRLQRHRKYIKTRPNDLCANCHTKQLRERLQDIRALVSVCNPRMEAMQIVERRITAVSNFLLSDPKGRFAFSTAEFDNYPTESLNAEHHLLQLELEACQTAIEGFVEARRCLRSSVDFTSTLIERTTHIGDAALAWSRHNECSKVVQGCLLEIMKGTEELAEEIQRDQAAESLYLMKLDAEARNLQLLLNDYDPQIGERFGKLLSQG